MSHRYDNTAGSAAEQHSIDCQAQKQAPPERLYGRTLKLLTRLSLEQTLLQQ